MADVVERLTPEEEQAVLIMQMEQVAELRMRRDELERLESVARPDAKLKLIEDDEDDQQRDLKLSLDGGQKRKIVQQLDKLLKKADEDMGNDRGEWDKIDDAYKAKLQARSYSWQSNICTPVVQIKCDKVHGAIVNEIANGNPLFALEPQETSDVERVKKIEKFLEAEGIKEMGIVTQIDYVADDSVRYGTGFMECPWVYETESVTEVHEYDGLKLEDMVKFDETFPGAETDNPEIVRLLVKGAKVRFAVEDKRETYRGPRPKHVPIRDMRQPKGYNDPNKMPFQFKRWMISWSELEIAVRDGKYEQAGLDAIIKKWGEDEKKKEKKDPVGYIKKEYEIFEGWWVYNIAGKVREKCVFTIIPEFVAYLRGMRYPFTHNRSYFIEFKIMEQTGAFYGLGIGGRARRIQYVMNMILNNAIDSDAANWPMYVHKTSTRGQNLDRQGYRPFKVFEVALGDDLTALPSGASTSNSLQLYSLLQRIGDDATRVSELYTGGESKGDPKAPAAKTRMLLQVSQQGLVELLKTFLKGWTELTFQIIELYSQYGTKGKEFRILNDTTGELSLEAVPDGNLNVRPDMQPRGLNPNFAEDGKKRSLIELMMMMMADPVIQALVTSAPEGSAAWLDNWQRLIEVWDGGLDKAAHELMGPLKQIIQQQMQAAQQQEQMQAAEQAVIADEATPEEIVPSIPSPELALGV